MLAYTKYTKDLENKSKNTENETQIIINIIENKSQKLLLIDRRYEKCRVFL